MTFGRKWNFRDLEVKNMHMHVISYNFLVCSIHWRDYCVNFMCFYGVWIRRRWPHVSKEAELPFHVIILLPLYTTDMYFLCDIDVNLKINTFLNTRFRFYFPERQHGTRVTFIPPFIRHIHSFCLVSCSFIFADNKTALNEHHALTHLRLVPHICDSESGQHWFR